MSDLIQTDHTPIADLSYRNYDGPLRPPTFRWWTIARQTIRAVSKKKMLWIMSGLAGAYFLIMIIFLFVVDRLVESNPNMAQFQNLLVGQLIWKEQFAHGVGFAQIPSMVIALIVGAGAIANDNRANALLVYLSKPCTRFDYAFGKWMGVFMVLIAALAIPALAFYAYGALSFRDLGFFKQDPWLLLRVLATLPLCAALNTSIILAISSLFKQGRMAGAVYAGIYFLGDFFTKIMGAVWTISGRERGAPEIVKYLYYSSIDGLQIGLSRAILGAKGNNLLGIPISNGRGMPLPPSAPPLVPCLLIVLVITLEHRDHLEARSRGGGGRVIEFNHVSKWYGEVIAVNDVSFTLAPGVTALLGSNGAGKSTLMKLVTGQIRPSTGELTVFGEAPFANPEVYKRLGYCPEIDAFPEHQTGRAFVNTMARFSGLSASKAKARAEEVLHEVGMAERANRKVGGYSKGMRQRIKLAQAMLLDPDIIVLDEPLNGLDPVGRREFLAVLEGLADRGKTILVSSHILFEVEQMTRSILLLTQGQLLAQGDLSVIRRYLDRFPQRIRIDTEEPRRLAERLVGLPYVLSVEMDPRGTGIEVRTKEPDAFYDSLGKLILDEKIPVGTFHSPDNDLESIFRYLTTA